VGALERGSEAQVRASRVSREKAPLQLADEVEYDLVSRLDPCQVGH
jgi:hypothetical protein